MKTLSTVLTMLMLQACTSGGLDVSSTNLLGSWKAVAGDEGITLILKSNQKYEWVVEGGENAAIFEDNATMKKNSDGGYSLLGEWSLTGDKLTIEMLGESEVYNVAYLSDSELKLTGYENMSFNK